jgi:uncharacterized repeat protein (TIGR01451 family)
VPKVSGCPSGPHAREARLPLSRPVRRLLCILALLSALLAPRVSFAYETLTHRQLTELATERVLELVGTRLQQDLDLPQGINEVLAGRSVAEWLRVGSVDEDDLAALFRVCNHFHDPTQHTFGPAAGLSVCRNVPTVITRFSSGAWAQMPATVQEDHLAQVVSLTDPPGKNNLSWHDARSYFFDALTHADPAQRELKFADTLRSIGAVMHLVQDASVPSHTRNDPHFPFWDLDPDLFHSWVETRYDARRMRQELTPFFPSNNLLREPGKDTLHAPLPIANLIDADRWDGEDAGTIDRTLSTDVGVAEFSNATFFSEGQLNGTLPGSNTRYPYPEREMVPSDLGNGYYAIKRNNTIIVDPAVKCTVDLSDASACKWTLNDDLIYQEYAKHLLPRAIGYSSKVLEYFFRGSMEITSVGPGQITIKNTSEERMTGQAFLYYDDVNGIRRQVSHPRWDLALAGLATSGPLSFTEPSSPPPSEAGKYMLVFKGSLGFEPGAVVGKVVSPLRITSPSPLPDGSANADYSVQLAAAGGRPPYTWSPASVMPAGLSLASNGVITGTPTSVSTASFTVQVDDTAGGTTTKRFSLTIKPPTVPSLAFASDRTGRFQVWTVPTDSSGITRQVTTAGTGSQESRGPDWSRAGNRLAYQFGASGVRGIYSIAPDGSGNTRLTTFASDERDPSWSPKGRWFAYARLLSGGNYDIWIHDLEARPGNEDYGLIGITPTSVELRPAWSPDFTRIAFTTTASSTGGIANGGAEIAVVEVRHNTETDRIELASPSATFLTDNAFIDFDPSWSPDSKHIVFASTRTGGRDIYRMSAALGERDPTNLVQLTTHPGVDSNPAWSSDGKWIAFTSERDGNREIYAMSATLGEADSTSLRRLTNNTAIDDDPAWEPVPDLPSSPPSIHLEVAVPTVAAGTTNPTRGTVTVRNQAGEPVEGAIVTIQGPLSVRPENSSLSVAPRTGTTGADGTLAFTVTEPSPGIAASLVFGVLASGTVGNRPATAAIAHTIDVGGVPPPPPGPPGAAQLTPQQLLPLGTTYTAHTKAYFAQAAQHYTVAGIQNMTLALSMPALLPTLRSLYAAPLAPLFLLEANRWRGLAKDPPDPNFDELAVPVLRLPAPFVGQPPLSSGTVDQVNQRLSSRALIHAHLVALQVSSDRYITALAAGDLASAELQRDAMVSYGETLSQLLANDARVGERLLAALRADGVTNVSVTPADFVATQHEIATNGFPNEILQVFKQLQLSTDEVDLLRTSIVGASPPTAASDFLSDLQADVMSSRAGAAAFAAGPRTWVASDLQLTIAASPDPATVARDLTYSMVVTNLGPEPATNVTLTDILPTGAAFVSATSTQGTCSAADGIMTCAVGLLTASVPGNTARITLVLAPTQPGTLENTAATTSSEGDPSAANNTATHRTTVGTTPPPDLAVTKTHPGDFTVGVNATYQMTVSNVGAGPTTGVVTLTDVLPAGLTYEPILNVLPDGWNCSANGSEVSCTSARELLPGQSRSLVLGVGVGSAAVPSVRNTVHVATAGDTYANNDTSSDLAMVSPAPVTHTPTDTPTATATDTPTATATETPTATATDTASPTETTTATPTDSPTETPTATATPTETPTETATASPTDSATATSTDTPTSTPSDTPTASATSTVSATPSGTPSDTATSTATPTPSDTPTGTATSTPTATASETSTATSTSTATATASVTATETITATRTATDTPTPTTTPSRTQTPHVTITATPSYTATTTVTPTHSVTPTPTRTPSSTSTASATSTPSTTATLTTTPVAPLVLIGQQSTAGQDDSSPPGVAEAFQYTALASGTARQLAVFIDRDSRAREVVVGLYANGPGDSPGGLLARATINRPAEGEWNAVSLPPVEVTAGAKYWIALLAPRGAAVVRFHAAEGGGRSQISDRRNLDDLPATWTPGRDRRHSPLAAYVATEPLPAPAPVLLGIGTIGREVEVNRAGVAEAFRYTASATGTVDALNVYIDAASAASPVVVGLYGDGWGNRPGMLMTQATIEHPVAGQWNSVSVAPVPVSAGKRYWIAVLGPAGGGPVRLRGVETSGRSQTSSLRDLARLPPIWIPGVSARDELLSAYASGRQP